MHLTLTEPERKQSQALRKQRRDGAGYVKVTRLRLLDKGWAVATIAEALGLDDGTVYRYAQAYQTQGLAKYLLTDQACYWGLLTSSQLAHLCQKVNRTLYLDGKGIRAWLRETCQIHYSVSGLTDRLHRLGANALVALSCFCRPIRPI